MTCGILIFPGAHGDKELYKVLTEKYGMKVKMVWNHETNLQDVDILFIPGGFPCKGSSSSSRCMKGSAVIDSMLDFVERGKILIGIGNGFRVLCETELIPGDLRMNKTQRFICRYTFIKPDNDDTLLTRKMSNDKAYRIPIATGYGRFTAREEILINMRYNEQILFRYCDENGRISESNNITGAVDNIAGVCNDRRNVFGIVPQPERAVLADGGNTDGRYIFESLMEYF